MNFDWWTRVCTTDITVLIKVFVWVMSSSESPSEGGGDSRVRREREREAAPEQKPAHTQGISRKPKITLILHGLMLRSWRELISLILIAFPACRRI